MKREQEEEKEEEDFFDGEITIINTQIKRNDLQDRIDNFILPSSGKLNQDLD